MIEEINPVETEIEELFLKLLAAVGSAKPNDRSETDRWFAILKTDLEKAHAFYLIYCA